MSKLNIDHAQTYYDALTDIADYLKLPQERTIGDVVFGVQKKIEELESCNLFLKAACTRVASISTWPLEYGCKVGPEFYRARKACEEAISA